jgi:hypothetical protein
MDPDHTVMVWQDKRMSLLSFIGKNVPAVDGSWTAEFADQ